MESSDSNANLQYELMPFTFTGKAGEFFNIWIVNICLTILTLGIYSAWAKVRTQRYFYGNIKLDDVSFRYLASPVQILKGRIIAFALFMAYYFSGLIGTYATVIALVIIMLLVPALIVMSMSFRLRNSSYRNVIFDFNKNFKRAYFIFSAPVIMIGAYIFFAGQYQANIPMDPETGRPNIPIVLATLPFVIMIFFPWWEFLITQFKVVHTRFGQAEFTFKARAKDYYMMYLFAFLLPGLAVILFFSMIGVIAPFFEQEGGSDMNVIFALIFIPLILGGTLFYFWLFAYLQTKRTNLLYNNIKIDDHQLRSHLKVGYMTYLYFTNTIAITLSLGLLIPWARIRTARYRAEMTALRPAGDLNAFVNQQADRQSALGEEIGEMFDMDLGF